MSLIDTDIFVFDYYNANQCKKHDALVSQAIKSFDDLQEIRYSLCYAGEAYRHMVQTKNKINNIFKDVLKNKEIEFYDIYYSFKSYRRWIQKNVERLLVNRWIDDEEKAVNIGMEISLITMARNYPVPKLDILNKLVNISKEYRTARLSMRIGYIFCNLSIKDLIKGCEILSKSTPSIAVNLLKREDISEKYIIKGLRSLSKLSKQRNIKIKIDFSMLKNLGPKARLDAMKQLLGMFNLYYKYMREYGKFAYTYGQTLGAARHQYEYHKDNMPFTKVPSKEEVEQFLFPCSIKYNNEVVELVSRFEDIINQKP